MDLSHPNLRAFVGRISRLAPKLVLSELEAPSPGRVEERLINLLTVMENNIEDFFILMEYFLKNRAPVPAPNGIISLGDREFDTILLTPLIVDFGYKHIKYKTFYNMALGKPVVGQTVDVLNAIRKYCTHEVVPRLGSTQEGATVPRVSPCLFEIYPFLGINPRNYELGKMTELLHRCFDGYTGRKDDLHANMGSFTGAIDEVASNVFAGIKLYPPLDFDPWPRRKSCERDKVEALYRFCESRQIPITAHCSDLGFTVANKADAYTNPRKWRKVLKHYCGLKLNLAHFGDQRKMFGFIPRHKWRESIIDLILTYDKVYTDISCLAFDKDFYNTFDDLLQSHEADRDKLSQRILFGSDFMINLMWANSYNEYLDLFIKTKTKHMGDREKVLFCNGNPARFLFL
jgi:hypothetical protein